MILREFARCAVVPVPLRAMRSLLEHQRALCVLLASSRRYSDLDSSTRAADLDGLPADRLAVVGGLVLRKRRGKVTSVFPLTFQSLGPASEAVFIAFSDSCPQIDISRRANAEQFVSFLQAMPRREPPYLVDLARFELDFWLAARGEPNSPTVCGAAGVRLRAGVRLLALDYDLSPIVSGEGTSVEARPTYLALVQTDEGSPVGVFELRADLFEMLRSASPRIVIDIASGDVDTLVSTGLAERIP